MDGINTQNNNQPDRYQLRQSAKSIATSAAIAGISGGGGRAVTKAAEAASSVAMSRGAEALAKRVKNSRNKKKKNARSEGEDENNTPAKKLTGPLFWFLVLVVVIKDALDIFLTASFFLSVLIIPLTLAISFTVFFYYFYNDVKPTIRKMVTIILSFIVEFLPLLGMLPTATLSLFLVKYFENKKHKKGGGVLFKAINKATA